MKRDTAMQDKDEHPLNINRTLLREMRPYIVDCLYSAKREGEPYCVVSVPGKGGRPSYRTYPYPGLFIDPEEATLVFFAGSRPNMSLLALI